MRCAVVSLLFAPTSVPHTSCRSILKLVPHPVLPAAPSQAFGALLPFVSPLMGDSGPMCFATAISTAGSAGRGTDMSMVQQVVLDYRPEDIKLLKGIAKCCPAYPATPLLCDVRYHATPLLRNIRYHATPFLQDAMP
eukprot:2241302-Rhodomonas_salina.1